MMDWDDRDFFITVNEKQYDVRLVSDFYLEDDEDEITLYFVDGSEVTFSKSDDLTPSDQVIIDQLVDCM